MSKPTLKLMEELLKIMDEQQAEALPQAQPPGGRTTTPFSSPTTTIKLPAVRTNAFPGDRRRTKAMREENEF